MSEGNAALERAVRTTNWRFWMLGGLALLGLAVLAALILLQQRADAERDRAIALQQHTFEVIVRANELSGAISSAEAALGRYVVSADKSLGQQYTERWSRAGEQLARLRQVTADSAPQQARLKALQRAFDRRGQELNETALYSTFKRHNDAWGSYYNVRLSPARAQLETLLSRVAEAERGLLRDRTVAAADLVENSALATRILSGFGVAIVLGAVLLGWLAIEAQGERAASDANAHAERERATQFEQAVASATEQLREEAHEREMAEARLRQAQKMEAVGQLTGGIAHDFNNMLSVVLGGLELAKRHIGPDQSPTARRHIDNAMDGASRAAALTQRLLAFSRAEALLPEAVDPDALIQGMSELLDRSLGDTVAVRTNKGAKGWRVWVDPNQLENAVLNLALNGRDAMQGRGRLTISTGIAVLGQGEVGNSAPGEYATLTVRDTGSGMSPEVLDRAFEPFFTTKPVGKGTGLGLSQIFGFVRQSGGQIAIETAEGKGTSVMLYLPRYLGNAELAEVEALTVIEPAEQALDILVVEDDPRVLNLTLAALAELGHNATACSDPTEARATVEGMLSLDLILSDVLMPGMTGPEMIASLGDRLRGVAVLFVTGYAGEGEAVPEMFGGRAVLRKPFTIAALSRAIDSAMEQEAIRALIAAR